MPENLLEIMCGLYHAQGIQILQITSDYKDLSRLDYGFRRNMFEGYDYLPIIAHLDSFMRPGVIYQFEDDFNLYYACLRLPEEIMQNHPIRFLIVGPILFHPISASSFQKLMKHKQIPLELHWEVQEFYNRIPLVGYYDSWYNALYFMLSRICGQQLELRMVSDGTADLFQSSYEDYPIPASPQVAQKSIEDRYAMEARMIQAVSVGDLEHALEYHLLFWQYKLLPRTPDSVRNKKNLIIVLNTLLRKAVQIGGVHPLYIDQLSRHFAIQIESCSTLAQLDPISNLMIRKYCMLVKNYSRKAYSSLIQTCMDYIDFHYVDEVTLDFMAKMCVVSNSYLSALFKKETGMTLTDYVNSTRVRHSLVLLNTTNLSIQEIASQCGFSDSNYFTRTFKKYQGKSPKIYREEVRK